MIELPRRPEGTAEEQIEYLWERLYKMAEEINRLEERLKVGGIETE